MQRDLIDTRAVLDTPEGVQLTFRLAGAARRMSAYVVDLLVRIAALLVITIVLTVGGVATGLGEVGFGFGLVAAFMLDWMYQALFEWLWNGRTPGKRMMNLRVLKDGGYPIGFYEAMLRNLLRAGDAPILPLYGIGLTATLLNDRMQRLGDLAAGTIVVEEVRDKVPYRPRDLSAVPIIKQQECLNSYHVSERTLDIVSRLFERKGYLSTQRREAIAEVLAGPIATKLGFDLEAIPLGDRGSRFLIRVIRTFGSYDETSEFVESEDDYVADDLLTNDELKNIKREATSWDSSEEVAVEVAESSPDDRSLPDTMETKGPAS